MFIYNWWRADRYIASINYEKESYEFPRQYFVREVLGIIASTCLNDHEQKVIQGPYEYGNEFIELPSEDQVLLEAKMNPLSKNTLARILNKLRQSLDSDIHTWEPELDVPPLAYISAISEAEAFLFSLDAEFVFWSVHYDE